MSRTLLLSIRDLVVGVCIGAALFGTGYVLGATHPSGRMLLPTDVPVDFDRLNPNQHVELPT